MTNQMMEDKRENTEKEIDKVILHHDMMLKKNMIKERVYQASIFQILKNC